MRLGEPGNEIRQESLGMRLGEPVNETKTNIGVTSCTYIPVGYA